MKFLLILSIVAISLVSCKSKKATQSDGDDKLGTSTEVSKDSLFASYEKTACFGMCPIFKLTVYKSGLSFYEGMKNVDKIGLYKGYMNQDDLSKLLNFADEMNYFQMEEVYDGNVSDLPSTIFVINNGQRKQVLNRYQGPEELKALADRFNALISKTDWKKESTKKEAY